LDSWRPVLEAKTMAPFSALESSLMRRLTSTRLRPVPEPGPPPLLAANNLPKALPAWQESMKNRTLPARLVTVFWISSKLTPVRRRRFLS